MFFVFVLNIEYEVRMKGLLKGAIEEEKKVLFGTTFLSGI